MKEEMTGRANRQDFERAIELRDEINALERLSERQRVEQNRKYDQDVISYLMDKEIVYLMLFKVYRGTLAGKEVPVSLQRGLSGGVRCAVLLGKRASRGADRPGAIR